MLPCACIRQCLKRMSRETHWPHLQHVSRIASQVFVAEWCACFSAIHSSKWISRVRLDLPTFVLQCRFPASSCAGPCRDGAAAHWFPLAPVMPNTSLAIRIPRFDILLCTLLPAGDWCVPAVQLLRLGSQEGLVLFFSSEILKGRSALWHPSNT